MTTTIAESVTEVRIDEPDTCEALIYGFLGVDIVCGQPAIGLFLRACVHEHVRKGLLCRDHAETPENGLCRACWDLPGGDSHECPIMLSPAVTS